MLYKIIDWRIYTSYKKDPQSMSDQENSLIELTKDYFNKDPLFTEKNRKDRYIERLQDGHRCYAYIQKGKIIAYFWVSDSNANLTQFAFKIKLSIPKNTAYIWDCRTAPDFKRQGLYSMGLSEISRIYSDKYLSINCIKHNIASKRGIEKANFIKHTHIMAVILLQKYSFCWLSKYPFKIYINSIDMHRLID